MVDNLSQRTLENIKTTVTDQLKAILVPVTELQHGFEEGKKRLQHCAASQSNYFEVDEMKC